VTAGTGSPETTVELFHVADVRVEENTYFRIALIRSG
jgi:hypothetical protein